MLGEERLETIVDIVSEKKSISIQELVTMLDSSESTVRRAITTLAKEGRVKRVHGGVMALESTYTTEDKEVSQRKELNKDSKLIIAKAAAELIKDGDVVYIDAGTTTELMIDFIKTERAMFVTNSFSQAIKLAKRGFTSCILGGEVKSLTEAIVGEEAIFSLEKYNFTKGFFGTNGVTMKNGFTTPDLREALVKSKAMSKTRDVYVLADASKFDEISSVTFADFDDAIIITDRFKDKYKDAANIVEAEEQFI